MFHLRFLLGLGPTQSAYSNDAWALVSQFLSLAPAQSPGSLLLAIGSATGHLHLLDTASGYAMSLGQYSLPQQGEAAVIAHDRGWHLYTAAARGEGSTLMVHEISTSGRPGASVPLRVDSVTAGTLQAQVIAPLTFADATYLAIAPAQGQGLQLLRLDPSGMRANISADISAGPKAALADISDLLTLQVQDQTILLAASRQQDGLSSFLLSPDGQMVLADSLTAKQGLWVQGLDVLASSVVAGQSFVIAGSAASNSLSVLRINALGVMFITDQMIDNRNTRFGQPRHIETFSHESRGFVIAAGGDGGFSLLEVLPDGRLFHHLSLEARDSWSTLAGGVSGLHLMAQDQGILVLAAGAGGVAQFHLDLRQIGPSQIGTGGGDTLTGGTGDDLIFGSGGTDRLFGGAGDDLLIAAAGSQFYGGAGADVFQPGPGGAISAIRDFEFGQDRLDLGDWGRIYDPSALSIRARSYGGEISYNGNTVQIYQAGGGRIEPTAWGADNFIF